jgi:hypothetical protein
MVRIRLDRCQLNGANMDFLLNNSLFIVTGIAFTVFGIAEYRRYLDKRMMTNAEFIQQLRERLNDQGSILAYKLLTSVIVTLVISMVSFRQLWMNDCFHIVFLTAILFPPTLRFLRKLVS